MNGIRQMKAKEWEIPMVIGGGEIFTENKIAIHPPHELSHTLGYYSRGDRTHARDAIKADLDANTDWEKLAREDRAAIFLKAAELHGGPWRTRLYWDHLMGL